MAAPWLPMTSLARYTIFRKRNQAAWSSRPLGSWELGVFLRVRVVKVLANRARLGKKFSKGTTTAL